MQNTGKITRAMEAVAATKMRKAQQVALAARPYAEKALELLGRLSGKIEVAHWLLEKRPIERILLVLVTSDKGLCGVLNNNAIRRFETFVKSHADAVRESRCDFVTVGNYGARYLKRRGYALAKEFVSIGDIARLAESQPVSDFVLEGWRARRYDKVFAVYTNFISTLKQSATLQDILPLTKEGIGEIAGGMTSDRAQASSFPSTDSGSRAKSMGKPHTSGFRYEYKFEPSPGEILETLLPALLRVRIYQAILESNASEHSARMVAMKNASDNAEELLEELRLFYNKARQTGITREIAEISAGAAALEN